MSDNSKINYCPECGTRILSNARYCKCGFSIPASGAASSAAKADGRCAYAVAGKRCPLPGSMSPQAYGSNSLYYCSLHYKCIVGGENALAGEAMIDYAHKNYSVLIKERQGFRPEIPCKELCAFHAQHPDKSLSQAAVMYIRSLSILPPSSSGIHGGKGIFQSVKNLLGSRFARPQENINTTVTSNTLNKFNSASLPTATPHKVFNTQAIANKSEPSLSNSPKQAPTPTNYCDDLLY